MHRTDIACLIGYFVLVTGMGFWAARRVGSMADFILPRRFGKVLMLFYAFGAGTHSDQAVSVAAKSYSNGMSGIWYQWLWLFASPFYWLIAPMMRRFRALTTADVFELRYGRSVSMLFAVVGLLQYTVNIGVMLKGSSHVIEASTGGVVEVAWAIPIMTGLFVAYGMAGGLHAAILTDFIQGLLTVVFSFLLLPFVLEAVGGLAGMKAALPPDRLSLVAPGEITVFYVVVIALNAMVGIVTQPHTMSNCAAGRTELDGQVGFMCGNLLKRVCTIAWTLTGVAAFAYFTKVDGAGVAPDDVFGEVAHRFLPQVMPGLLGLFLAGVLASVMSSCDAFMIATSGLFTQNIYKVLRPGASEKHYLLVARLAALLVVVSGVAFAYSLDSVVSGLETFWKITAMLGIAFWLGAFWRGATTAGAWAGTLVAFGAWWLSSQTFFVQWIDGWTWAEPLRLVFDKGDTRVIYLPWQMIFYLGGGLLAGIGVSWITPAMPQPRLDHFYGLIRTPVRTGEQVAAPCTLPAGMKPAAARKLIPHPALEIYVPSRRMIAGFAAGWLAVLLLIGLVMALVR